jgi:sulfur carrier protein ThiS
MRVSVVLHSVLADRLPEDAQGQATLDLPGGCTLVDALDRLGVSHTMLFTVNGRVEPALTRVLVDNDRIEVYVRLGGG